MPSVASMIELQAKEVGNNSRRLKKLLIETKALLASHFLPFFKEYTFDAARKRLYSGDGEYFLEWTLRRRPDLPESYENQQTSLGCVQLHLVFNENEAFLKPATTAA